MGEEVGLQREGGGKQRYPVALPGCSIQRTWHSPWGEGEGVRLSPPRAEPPDMLQGGREDPRGN